MFSGIIEGLAIVKAINAQGGNMDFTLECDFAQELTIDQSVAHNGVCLTVVSIDNNCYTVTAIKETLDRSNLGLLHVGDKVNDDERQTGWAYRAGTRRYHRHLYRHGRC